LGPQAASGLLFGQFPPVTHGEDDGEGV
jgi:hypothetical protein